MTPAASESPDPERGAGTVLVLAVVAAAATGLLTVSLLAAAHSGRSAAQTAADLAAIAVADQVARGITGAGGSASAGLDDASVAGETPPTAPAAPATDGTPFAAACAAGQATAEANGCHLTSCDDLGAGVVEVRTSRRTAAGVARAVARAGPEEAR